MVDLLRDQEKRRAKFQNMVATARQRVLGKRLVAEDFEKAIRCEHVLYGPLTQAGMDAFQLTRAESAHGIVQLQRDLAMDILLLTGAGLRRLPSDVRLRIYSFGFTPRALSNQPSERQVHDGTRVSIKVTAAPKFDGLVYLNGEQTLTIPTSATVNDVIRMIHKMLWDENEAKPPEERYSKYDMKDPFHPRWSLPGANLSYGPTKYVGGARSSKQLLASLDRGRDGLPEMLVLV